MLPETFKLYAFFIYKTQKKAKNVYLNEFYKLE